MSLRIPMLLIAATLSFPLFAAAPQLGQQKFYGDWTVACDNRLSCEAVSLPVDAKPDDRQSIMVKRDSQGGEIAIEIYGLETTGSRYRIIIDRKTAHSGAMPANAGDPVLITGPDALRLARKIAIGTTAILADGAGKELSRVSLSGSRQALAQIDRIQNRSGTASALAKTGRQNLRPKSMPTPVIQASRVIPVDRIPDAATLVSLAENSVCKDSRTTVTEDRAYSLGMVDGAAKALVLISCGSGAYNFTSAIFVGTESLSGKWSFAPAQLDYDDNGRMMEGGVLLMVNAGWDASTQKLGSFNKGRGLGDCGEALDYGWDGATFRLVSAIGMAECRGSMDWLTLWQAEVKLVD
jgi:hypothetical protein